MWLLTTDRAELHYFPRNFDAIGGYAILSHTWVGKEQTLQELQVIIENCRRNSTNPRDFVHPKIRNCCIVAEKHGYRWVWIDSCCIDKTSSSELSEAINSMFRWYKEAEVCFAYLADVPTDCDLCAPNSAFRKSRMHTRAWTLQELIAPEFLIFLSKDWHELGNRADLAVLLEEITRVPAKVLTGEEYPAQYSVSTRMSWASKRKPTRVEDEAYCLMGLFGVSLPTNYGEGKKAFIRLQYEIMQHNPDMSLFAFGYPVDQDEGLAFYPEEEVKTMNYLLADSLQELDNSFTYIPNLGTTTGKQYPPPLDSESTGPFGGGVELPRVAVTSYGIELRVPIHEAEGFTIAVILCQHNQQHFGLFLTRDRNGKDPTRPRYFTGCVYTDPEIGSTKYVARLANLGDDLHNLTFNGEPVSASWRTIYVVPTASDLEVGRSTTPNLIMNCNPASNFRIPRWLIAQFITLGYEVEQVKDTTVLNVIRIFHAREAKIFVSFGSCTKHCRGDHSPDKPVRLWAKVALVRSGSIDNFPHRCSKDHLDSPSWATNSKFFGDKAGGVQLSLTPSTRMLDRNKIFVIHLELLGDIFKEMLQESGVSSLFPSLVELQGETSCNAPNDSALPSRPPNSSHQTHSSSSSSSTHSSTSITVPRTKFSRIRLRSRSPSNSHTQGRMQESDDDWPQAKQGRGSQRQGEAEQPRGRRRW